MTTQRTISIVGLPRTGKSTYLGALWLLVQDPSVPDVWEKDVSGDRSYVDWLAQQVARGEEIERTTVDSDQRLVLELGFREQGVVRVNIPDLSGEAVRQLVEERVWRKVLAEALLQSEAVMLFVHPDHIDFPVPANLVPGTITEQATLEEDSELPEFTPEKACTAAKLVELLENLVELRWELWPIPIAVVVSAWDRVDPGQTPATWLDDRLQGVSAFLQTNSDLANHSVFGVSAQGGRLPDDRDELLAKGDVSQRVFAVAADGGQAELYDPLRWVVWS